MKVILIVAIGKNNEIGLDNKLLWKSKSDLSNFKRITEGYPIIMGRKTFESLPKILPNREHIVITANPIRDTLPLDNENVRMSNNLGYIISQLRGEGLTKVYIIGGASIYKQALEQDLVDEMLITNMVWEGEADTFFPEIDMDRWDYHSDTEIFGQFHDDELSPEWRQTRYIRDKTI